MDRDIGTAARVLEEAATRGLARSIGMPAGELAEHLATMGEFSVKAGPRDEEVCALEWAWEVRIPELDTPELKRTVFIIPEEVTKCFTDDPNPRLLVLNDPAQRIVDAQRGLHPR